jgi:hypothetical protein
VLHPVALIHTVLLYGAVNRNSFFIYYNFNILTFLFGARGSAVVKALCYKSEGRGFDTR